VKKIKTQKKTTTRFKERIIVKVERPGRTTNGRFIKRTGDATGGKAETTHIA